MKQYKNAKLLSEDCMVKRDFYKVRGGINNRLIAKYINTITIIKGRDIISLDKEEVINLKNL